MSSDSDIRPRISVVVPARNAARTLPDCLRGLASQNLANEAYEVIVVADGRSRDATTAVARGHAVTVAMQSGIGAGAARNDGTAVARGDWVAFTDADCMPSRGWLRALLSAVDAVNAAPTTGPASILGAAGPTLGYESRSAAARYVDLTGGLQAEKHLAHPRYPWAPTSNVLYRRDALVAVGGFDPRFASYEGCDLHTRLLREVGGRFTFVPRAVVHHRHRDGWRAYWRQQVAYGRGYAQFFRRYQSDLSWSAVDEARALVALVRLGGAALIPGGGDDALVRRGRFIKALAQRIGFIGTYWSRREKARWRPAADLAAAQSK